MCIINLLLSPLPLFYKSIALWLSWITMMFLVFSPNPWEISIPNNLGNHIFHTHKLCFYWTCSIDFPRLALNMPHCLPCSLRPRRDSSCNREWKMHHPPNIWSNWCHRSSILMVNSKFLVNISSSMTISCNRGCIVISHMWVGMLQ